MLNQIHAAADLAAQHRQELLAEAAADRLARTTDTAADEDSEPTSGRRGLRGLVPRAARRSPRPA